MKKFLLALFFTAFALTGAHAQPAQQSPAQPDVKPTILDPVANKRVAEISAQLRCLVCQNQSIADSNAELAMDLKKQVVKQIDRSLSLLCIQDMRRYFLLSAGIPYHLLKDSIS